MQVPHPQSCLPQVATRARAAALVLPGLKSVQRAGHAAGLRGRHAKQPSRRTSQASHGALHRRGRPATELVRWMVLAARSKGRWSTATCQCNTPTSQCDFPCQNCSDRAAAIDCPHEFHRFQTRVRRCIQRGGMSCCRVAMHCAAACRDGDSHLSAGRTSLGPAITSTPFAQTSDRRAPSSRVDACLLPGGTQSCSEGMPRGSRDSRAYAH